MKIKKHKCAKHEIQRNCESQDQHLSEDLVGTILSGGINEFHPHFLQVMIQLVWNLICG